MQCCGWCAVEEICLIMSMHCCLMRLALVRQSVMCRVVCDLLLAMQWRHVLECLHPVQVLAAYLCMTLALKAEVGPKTAWFTGPLQGMQTCTKLTTGSFIWNTVQASHSDWHMMTELDFHCIYFLLEKIQLSHGYAVTVPLSPPLLNATGVWQCRVATNMEDMD